MNDHPKPSPKPVSPWVAYSLVGELGYLIALPALLFGFGGAYLDKYIGSSPIFLILGLVIAGCASFFAVRRSVSLFVERQQKIERKPGLPVEVRKSDAEDH